VLVDRLCPSLPPPKLSLLFTSTGDTSKLASRPCRRACARLGQCTARIACQHRVHMFGCLGAWGTCKLAPEATSLRSTCKATALQRESVPALATMGATKMKGRAVNGGATGGPRL
jgi:hypothetical protein